MNTVDNKWRIVQIASTILYRCFGEISIYEKPNGILDLLVNYNDGTDLRFGVVVRSIESTSNEQKKQLIDEISSIDFRDEGYRLPIIVMYINEDEESAKVGFLVGWRFDKPRIYSDFELRVLNEKSAGLCTQIIKSMDRVIRLLSDDNLNVIKHISFSKKIDGTREQIAEIVYMRKLSSNYRMNEKEVVSERERLERMIKGIPEKEYPKDKLDEMIYDSVKQQFKNANVKSKLLLFSSELDDLQSYKNIHRHNTNLIVSPNMADLPDVVMTMLNGLELFSVPLEIYVDNIFYENAFDDVSFDKEEPIEGWIKNVVEWNKMKETLKPISMYFR